MSLESQVEFVDNPEPRCACVLLLDTSASMSGRKIHSLNEALQLFHNTLLQDDKSRLRVEAAVVTFATEVRILQDFVTADYFQAPTLHADGTTAMGAAVLDGLYLVERRKKAYQDNGVPYYRPWIFLITDGEPTDTELVTQATHQVREAEERKKAVFFSVGVEEANMDMLRRIAVREPLKLRGLNFREMFLWLSASLQAVSRSRVDEGITLPPPTGWMEIR
jgi:uncharacterized protein YegL